MTLQISRIMPNTLLRLLVAALVALTTASQASADQPVTIQTFSSQGPYGTQVTSSLPIYRLHVQNGQLVDDSGNPFNSYKPQWTTADSSCTIPTLNWAAYYTTFYVIPANDRGHILAVKSCGKSPLQMNSTDQFPNIGAGNFINHAQIAGQANGATNQVIAAGEMDVVNGKIVYMDTCSGHFKPNPGSFLAFASTLDTAGELSLTTSLKNIVRSGTITTQQIDANLTFMVDNSTPAVARNIRSGTGGCYSYTTVFAVTTSNGNTTLSGGLMALNLGNVNVFKTDINTITNRNVKQLYLTTNVGWYDFAAWVITDLHAYNNALDFQFTDETNDTYNLSVHVYSYNHQVDYDSDSPNVNKITFDWAPSVSAPVLMKKP